MLSRCCGSKTHSLALEDTVFCWRILYNIRFYKVIKIVEIIVTASAGFIAEDAPANFCSDMPPLLTQSPSGMPATTNSVSWERVAQETKRARAAYQSACELKNAAAKERAVYIKGVTCICTQR